MCEPSGDERRERHARNHGRELRGDCLAAIGLCVDITTSRRHFFPRYLCLFTPPIAVSFGFVRQAPMRQRQVTESVLGGNGSFPEGVVRTGAFAPSMIALTHEPSTARFRTCPSTRSLAHTRPVEPKSARAFHRAVHTELLVTRQRGVRLSRGTAMLSSARRRAMPRRSMAAQVPCA